MSTLMEDDIKLWTAKRKTAPVLDIIQVSLTCAGIAGSIHKLAEQGPRSGPQGDQ